MNPTAALILSDKSSGSSVLQRELTRHSAVSIMRKPHHQENETLFWSKAAALLDLDQPAMIDSTILPMTTKTAHEALQSLLADNLEEPGGALQTRDDVFGAWRRLTMAYGPVFLEKSPHHLHNIEVLRLLLEAQESMPDLRFCFIGLVRNPVDTMYSMWKRWRTVPEARESEWCRAYANLLWLAEVAPDQTHIVRYEDLASDDRTMSLLIDFLGLAPEDGIGETLHRRSVQAWRNDVGFGYQPSVEVRRIAAAFGYRGEDLDNSRHWSWPLRRRSLRLVRTARTKGGGLLRGSRK